MATVTTNSDPEGQPQHWIGPISTRAGVSGASPIGKIIFADDFTVAAKINTNESRVVMTATLPTGYFYRPSLLSVTALGTSKAAFNTTNGFEVGMGGEIAENSVLVYNFAVPNVGFTDGSLAIKTEDDAVTNDFQAYFLPRQPLSQILINASQGTSILELTWIDTSADATAAIQIRWRLEVMQLTIEQGLSFNVNAPALTYEINF